jgi:hypothetical protein
VLVALASVAAATLVLASQTAAPRAEPVDHGYTALAVLLRAHVDGGRVRYRHLVADRARLDAIVAGVARVAPDEEPTWPLARRLAFWINAYNVLTLQAIADHYPIRGRALSLAPRNSIRQIDGVWTKRRWRASGQDVTLDDIEHRILRKEIGEPRVHFALNCASVSCPPLAAEPYRAETIDAQLDAAARSYLATPLGLLVDGRTLRVSSLFKWYGDDFIEAFASLGPPGPSPRDRGVLGVIARYGPAAAADLARSGRARLAYLSYDWSLNDVEPAR